jgi:exodeoxyribonuclease V alpha subunit
MPETVSITVGAIAHLASNGSAIFSGVNAAGSRIRVVAGVRSLPRQPIVGEAWEITGEFREHPKYGRQLYATCGHYSIPKGRLIVNYLASHPDFAGIGESKAKALYEAFGDGLVTLLDAGDTEALWSVLTAPMADRLIDVWAEKRAEGAVVAFLDKHGFDVRLANKLRRVWGSQAIEMLELNPFYMLAFAGWKLTDSAASRLGVGKEDERRLIGAVEAALYERLQDAHTLSSADWLIERVAKFLSLDACKARSAIDLALQESAIVGNAIEGYQPTGAAALESRIADRIRAMIAGEVPTQGTFFNASVGMDWLAAAIAENETAQGFELNAQQRDAVLLAATEPFSVLTGGAGVGKTTVLRIVIDIAKRLNLKVLQMALAGRAAKRMTEATGNEAITIARFLHQAKEGVLEVTPDTLVIVDEASMLDLPTTFRLLHFLPEGARLLLVGDSAQLPPIGFGLVFHRLVKSPIVPQVELTEVHRQAAETGIPSVAESIREHEVPVIEGYYGRRPGVSFIECLPDEVQGKLRLLASDWQGNDFQILVAIKDGPTGIDAVNFQFHEACDTEGLSGFRFCVGEPVIHLVNDYDKGLMNGTLGRITAVANDGVAGLLVDFEGVEHFIPAIEIADRLALAHAISVHKAQGSQFRRVAVVVNKSRILDHALIYTGLTRGVEQVVFLGSKVVFEEAVRKPALAHQREVAFAL